MTTQLWTASAPFQPRVRPDITRMRASGCDAASPSWLVTLRSHWLQCVGPPRAASAPSAPNTGSRNSDRKVQVRTLRRERRREEAEAGGATDIIVEYKWLRAELWQGLLGDM